MECQFIQKILILSGEHFKEQFSSYAATKSLEEPTEPEWNIDTSPPSTTEIQRVISHLLRGKAPSPDDLQSALFEGDKECLEVGIIDSAIHTAFRIRNVASTRRGHAKIIDVYRSEVPAGFSENIGLAMGNDPGRLEELSRDGEATYESYHCRATMSPGQERVAAYTPPD
ncbi:hypothetical protein T265_12052 [Opisthorchis viverrini]|uniref:Uncharacterized protein n=1 Tax=Opisthorchis viverrini TaxID=6198 RepID=A0A074YWG5_OPIVI|nr:hypothetical protein T265_12052 [Opisthorchis viverrini]KER19023.1 hypothetical protein T265_12052 [Opisthorchis viverrini]